MASLSNVLDAVAVFVVAVALSGAGVYAQTHHVVGGEKGWGPDLDVDSWLSGRVFSVGDKIWFKYSGTENSVVELQGPEEFLSCNLTNPIRMYTDPVSHVVLDKEGFRYFTSRNPERCKNGLKLPVPVKPASTPFDPPFPEEVPTPPVDPHPHPPVDPSPPVDPNPPFKPSPPVEPLPPVKPTPPYEPPVHFPPPRVPVLPPPAPPPILPPPPPPPHNPPPPSAATRVEILSFVLGAALLLCSIGGI